MKFNKGSALDSLIRLFNIFGWSYSGEQIFVSEKGYKTKTFGFYKHNYTIEQAQLFMNILYSLFYNVKIFHFGRNVVYFRVVEFR